MADQHGNENCLEGYACPDCGEHERLLINVETRIEMTDRGSGEHEDLDYDDHSHADCPSCGYGGELGSFLLPDYADKVRRKYDVEVPGDG